MEKLLSFFTPVKEIYIYRWTNWLIRDVLTNNLIILSFYLRILVLVHDVHSGWTVYGVLEGLVEHNMNLFKGYLEIYHGNFLQRRNLVYVTLCCLWKRATIINLNNEAPKQIPVSLLNRRYRPKTQVVFFIQDRSPPVIGFPNLVFRSRFEDNLDNCSRMFL